MAEYQYYDRDLSWLSFNERVLQEAASPSVPLFERLKFLAIYSSNLDEFFRVRVAAINSFARLDKKKINKSLGIQPKTLLHEINQSVANQLEQFGQVYQQTILPELRKNHIYIISPKELNVHQQKSVEHYFRCKVLAYLQPILFEEEDEIPFLDNGALYFILQLKHTNDKKQPEWYYALLNIPSNELSRFFQLPSENDNTYFVLIDDVIRHSLPIIFPGYAIQSCHSIKINRDADLLIEDEFSGDLVEKIRKNLNKRSVGLPSRFLFDQNIPASLLQFLIHKLQLEEDEVINGGKYHNFNDFFKLPNPIAPQLENPPWPALEHPALGPYNQLFDAIDEQDFLLHFPYQSYDYVLRFFNEAAIDPFVQEIMVTVYRIAANSFIANALISAAKNGKKVTVFVEVKARFDEANNLKWAEEMEKQGVKIIYSIPGLKVHAKVALITRHKGSQKKSYAFLGTGNFNEITAQIYADHGLMTSNQHLTQELRQVFRFLHSPKEKPVFQYLMVAQINMLEGYLALIDREIANAKAGKKAGIILKLNGLEDKVMIDKLYEANNAGVKIDLIIRGICCLVPGIEGQSERITVTRIVDRYLEHARVLLFYNKGQWDTYLSSADWMHRNLFKRIEVGFPIFNTELKKELQTIIDYQLSDNTKSRVMDSALNNCPKAKKGEEIRAQWATYQLLKSKLESCSV
ncbi:polyphosphate kinase 1 [Rapidithrix thailandica]|uniref:Polyphosphate kinase n=1 Tax=Rapidithrix thailandica TaxID=413964 RepID=A0AAW9S7F1_9BACT